MTTTAYEALAAKLVEVTAERDRARATGAVLEQQVSAITRYATLTLDSISVERCGMAEDILSLLDPEADQ